MTSQILVRDETPEDIDAIRSINEPVFGRPDEADLVARLRDERVVLVSRVAEYEGQIVGHIMFTRMKIDIVDRYISAVALSPMAVNLKIARLILDVRLLKYWKAPGNKTDQ